MVTYYSITIAYLLLALSITKASEFTSISKELINKQKLFLSENNKFLPTLEQSSSSPKQANKSSITQKTIITAQKASDSLLNQNLNQSKSAKKYSCS